ncbi:hypothetical protein MSC49_37540 (plasmid) [Methylosinus sp. C49]|jgi:hypothetical protein|uniref:hypothetical protein n=1 Tax=Methylosinus sp. C49 TaxID=2699395 RepID=UPI00136772E7|nr:hypothetical protein [Methylosinus sp. C49]BBU63819.1 hypothetical protein MSC49_37540 [Methylosinus sp. C49]
MAFPSTFLFSRLLVALALPQILSVEPARGGAEKPLAEWEQLQLEQATLACQSRNYRKLFEAMIQSAAVRKKYAAPQIDYEERRKKSETLKSEIPKERYDKFPIQMFDFYWKTTVPAKPGDKDEYVMMEFNQSQNNQISVDWTRVHYRGPHVGEESLGTAYDLDGKPYRPGRRVDGQLLLYPTKDCWVLVADIRYRTR